MKSAGILVFSFLTICSYSLKAQPFFDLLNIQGQLSKPTKDHSKDSSGTETYNYSADLSVPLKIKKDYLAIGASYSILRVKQSNFREIDMRSILFSLAWVKQWKNEKLKTSFILISRANSEPGNSITQNYFQWGGAVLHTVKRRENFKYKFGLYYNSEFFGPFILPLVGIDWNINERLNLFGVLPGSMNLEYKLNNSIYVGAAFRSITNSYRMAANSFIRINDNHLKAVADFYLTKNHVLSLEAGHSILRKYKPGIRVAGETTYSDFQVNDGYLLKIAYAFRFRLDESK